jgi:hypothetical protein
MRGAATAAGRRPWGLADAVALGTLAASAVAVGWPVLSGGYATYLDNPAHVAEIYAAAFEARNGWSEIAFCGFPLFTLHSPLWYGALGLLARAGMPVGAVYSFFLWLGFVAPAAALYAVARRSLAPVAAAVLAFLLLVQRPAVVGVGSAFGGMWTFYLASAAVIMLVDRLTRTESAPRDGVWVAALVGFAVLTHLYTVIPLALIAVLHVWMVLAGRGGGKRRLARDAVAGGVGVMAASVYWVHLVLARSAVDIVPQNLSGWMVVARLAIPTNVLELVNGVYPAVTPRLVLEAVPMCLLLVAGAAGVATLGRRRDDAPLYGALLAVTLLSVLLVVTSEFDVKLMGPGSWRMLYFVRVGLVLAAIPFVARVGRGGHRAPPWAFAAPAVLAVAVAWWVGAPLRAVTPAPGCAEMAEVDALWSWLKDNRTDEWGRVYLQDTFERPRRDVKLSQSHILALTARRTGVRQVGATYGVAPYRTALWTPGEFGLLYRIAVAGQEDLDKVESRMWASNATHLVTSNRRSSGILDGSEDFERLYTGGRFAVFRATSTSSEWVSPLDPGVEVLSAVFETGRYRLRVRCRGPGSVLVKSSYHPGWRFSGVSTVYLHVDELGLMRVRQLPEGESDISMTFRLSRWPGVLSALAWTVIVAGVVLVHRPLPGSDAS